MSGLVIVLGATGFTGRLLCRALQARALPFVPAGRSEPALRALSAELGLGGDPLIADVSEPASLVSRLSPGEIVVNCVGPFGLYSQELTRALAAVPGLTALDVSGEQQFVQDSIDGNDAEARRAGATLIHSCAFESMLADLLAQELVGDERGLEDLSSFYWFERVLSSPGTRLTMRLVDHFRTVILRDGVLRPRRPGPVADGPALPDVEGRSVSVFAPYPEVIFFARRFGPRSAGSYLLLTPREAQLFTRAEGEAPPIEEVVRRHEQLPRREPTPAQRARQRCGVEVVAVGSGRRRSLGFTGFDPYGLTAELVAWACSWLTAHPGEVEPGVRSPGEVFPAELFLEELRGWAGLFESLRSR